MKNVVVFVVRLQPPVSRHRVAADFAVIVMRFRDYDKAIFCFIIPEFTGSNTMYVSR